MESNLCAGGRGAWRVTCVLEGGGDGPSQVLKSVSDELARLGWSDTGGGVRLRFFGWNSSSLQHSPPISTVLSSRPVSVRDRSKKHSGK